MLVRCSSDICEYHSSPELTSWRQIDRTKNVQLTLSKGNSLVHSPHNGWALRQCCAVGIQSSDRETPPAWQMNRTFTRHLSQDLSSTSDIHIFTLLQRSKGERGQIHLQTVTLHLTSSRNPKDPQTHKCKSTTGGQLLLLHNHQPHNVKHWKMMITITFILLQTYHNK